MTVCPWLNLLDGIVSDISFSDGRVVGKMFSKFKVLFIAATYIAIVSCMPLSTANGFPVYPGGFSVKKETGGADRITRVFFKVKIKFPAKDVINFYEKYLKSLKYIPYRKDEYGMAQWENFNSSTGNWEKTDRIPARYISSWVDNGKHKRIIFRMWYKYNINDPDWEKVLLVEFIESDFFDLRDMEKDLFKNDDSSQK